MLKYFTGTHDHRMDDKGRVSLPTEFRRVLDTMGVSGSLYVLPGLDDPRGLAFMTTIGYEKLLERHNVAEYPTPAAERLAEIKYITSVSQIQVDEAGRLVITKALREEFRLEKEVRFVGLASRFEIWRPDLREAHDAEQQAAGAKDAVSLSLRGLH